MSHDPLCPIGGALKFKTVVCQCDLIAEVRQDEKKAAGDRVEAVPYRDHGRTVNRRAAILAARNLPYSKAM